jgi:hypothetical protein
MARRQPIASMVTMAPSIAIMSSSFGIATIALDFSAPLPEHAALARCESRDHVNRLVRAFLLVGAACCLAIDGDHVASRPGQRCHPGEKAALEGFGIERGKTIAEVIVRRRPIAKRAEPAQPFALLLAEPGDVGDRLRPGEHRQTAQQQDLVEPVQPFAGLARVRQVLEIVQKNDRFAERTTIRRSPRPRRPANPIRGSRQIAYFSTFSRTSSPDRSAARALPALRQHRFPLQWV